MKFTLLFAPCFVMLLPGILAAQGRGLSNPNDREPTATVEVLVFDTVGEINPRAKIVVFKDYDQKDCASKFRNSVATGVPFGIYRIKVSALGFETSERFVRVFQARTTVVVGLPVGRVDDGPEYKLRGRVVGKPLPPGRKAFAKVTGVYTDFSMESQIDPDGGFELTGLLGGMHLLLVVSQDGILASRLVNIPTDILGVAPPPIEIEIKDDPALRWR